MTADWMAGGVAENDAAESRASERVPSAHTATGWMDASHPISCRCYSCRLDDYDPRDWQ